MIPSHGQSHHGNVKMDREDNQCSSDQHCLGLKTRIRSALSGRSGVRHVQWQVGEQLGTVGAGQTLEY